MFPIPTPLLRLLGGALLTATLAACGGEHSDPGPAAVTEPLAPADAARGCSAKASNTHCAP